MEIMSRRHWFFYQENTPPLYQFLKFNGLQHLKAHKEAGLRGPIQHCWSCVWANTLGNSCQTTLFKAAPPLPPCARPCYIFFTLSTGWGCVCMCVCGGWGGSEASNFLIYHWSPSLNMRSGRARVCLSCASKVRRRIWFLAGAHLMD